MGEKNDWRSRKRVSHQKWYFLEPKQSGRQFLGMIQEFMDSKRAERNKELWGMLAAYYSLTGARRSEPFLYNPTIQKIERNGTTYYEVHCANNKNWTGEGQYRRRKDITKTFMPADMEEKGLWKWLMHGNPSQITLDFRPLLGMRCKDPKRRVELLKHFTLQTPPGDPVMASAMVGVSERFSSLFLWPTTNGSSKRKGGVNIHNLRHQRAKIMLADQNIQPWRAEYNMGWKPGGGMALFYSDIANAMKTEDMINYYEAMKREREATSTIRPNPFSEGKTRFHSKQENNRIAQPEGET